MSICFSDTKLYRKGVCQKRRINVLMDFKRKKMKEEGLWRYQMNANELRLYWSMLIRYEFELYRDMSLSMGMEGVLD